MAGELARIGHPMLATLLTVSLVSVAQGEPPPPEPVDVKEDVGLMHELELIKEEQMVSGDSRLPDPVDVKEDAGLMQELELIKEEETVSIAARREQPISQAPSDVYVITDEDIRHSGAIDIPTLLRRIPGMEVMQTSGADFNVSVRGDNQADANKLLVMVDGRSIYIDVQGTVNWKLLPVTLPEIKRIEVLKGPASAVWGFNAFDGVVNIITKSPEEIKGTTLQFGGGSYGTITASAIQAGTVDKFGYRLSVGHNENASWNNSSALAFRDNLVNGLVEYALPQDSKIKLSGGVVSSNAYNSIISQDVINPIHPTQSYASVAYERPEFFIRGYWNQYNSSASPTFQPALAPFLTLTTVDGATNETFLANTYNVDVQHSLSISHNNRVTYGVNYRYNTLSSNAISQYSTENRLGFFAQDEWKVADPFKVVAGVRYDMDTFINPTVSPRVALFYSPSRDHTFRASGSVAYRPPTLLEKKQDMLVTTNPPLPPIPATIAGGQSLSPEEIISYEIGYQGWYWKHRLRLRANGFYNHISDLISTRNQSPTLATPTNDSGSADIYGSEVGFEVLATKWLTGFANYSYQEIHQTLSGRVQRAGPHNKFNIGLRGDWENGFSAEAIFHYYGSATYPPGQSFTTFSQPPFNLVTLPNPTVGSYNLLNLRAAYRFWHDRAEAAVSVFNALNDQHQEYPLGETIRSRIMGWLTLKF